MKIRSISTVLSLSLVLALVSSRVIGDSRIGRDLVRLGILSSVSATDGVVTGVAGRDFQYMRAPASKEGLCRSLLNEEKAGDASVRMVRLVDGAGSELRTCQ